MLTDQTFRIPVFVYVALCHRHEVGAIYWNCDVSCDNDAQKRL